jgi:hypothetical protein
MSFIYPFVKKTEYGFIYDKMPNKFIETLKKLYKTSIIHYKEKEYYFNNLLHVVTEFENETIHKYYLCMPNEFKLLNDETLIITKNRIEQKNKNLFPIINNYDYYIEISYNKFLYENMEVILTEDNYICFVYNENFDINKMYKFIQTQIF